MCPAIYTTPTTLTMSSPSFPFDEIALLVDALATKCAIDDSPALTAAQSALKAYIARDAAVAPAPAAKKPAVRKAKKAADAPADAAAAPVAETFNDPADHLRTHKYRLQTLDTTLCVARRVDEKDPIPGTRPGDEGANGKYYPEKQCSRKPVAGSKLCRFCADREAELQAGKPAHRLWFGRLDEPLYARASVVGCTQFYEKYPNGLKDDPTTAPIGGVPAPVAVEAAPAPAPAAKPKKVVARKKSAPAPAPGPVAPAVDAAPAPAPENDAPVSDEWTTFLYQSRPVIRNLKTHKVYEVDTHKTVYEEMVLKDKCLGRWIPEENRINPYDVDDE